MEHPPSDLLESLPVGSAPIAEQWWSTLSNADRNRIANLWDERIEVTFFTPQDDESGHRDGWGDVPKVAGGRFIASDDDGRDEWESGYFEHLLQHPELMLAYEPQERRFFIACTRHATALACYESGAVAVDFSCPFNASGCPMLRLRSAKLIGKPHRQASP